MDPSNPGFSLRDRVHTIIMALLLQEDYGNGVSGSRARGYAFLFLMLYGPAHYRVKLWNENGLTM